MDIAYIAHSHRYILTIYIYINGVNCDELVELRFYIIVNWFFFLLPRYGSTKFNHTHTKELKKKTKYFLRSIDFVRICWCRTIDNTILYKGPNIYCGMCVSILSISRKYDTLVVSWREFFSRVFIWFVHHKDMIWCFFIWGTQITRGRKKCSTFIYWVLKCL